MGVFNNSKIIFDVGPANLEAVLADAREHFQAKGFEVQTEVLGSGGGHLSLTRGGIFRAVLGLKTALNVEIDPRSSNWCVSTSVGIFGQQALPTVIMLFFAWPVLLTQIWGLVRQANLDDEAIGVVESALLRHAATKPGASAASQSIFCTKCGGRMQTNAKFCSECGQAVAAA